MTITQQAIEAAVKAAMEAAECSHPITKSQPICKMHGEPLIDLYVMDAFGYLAMTGICPVAKRDATAILTAALPALERQIREYIAREIEAKAPLAYYPHESGYEKYQGMKYAAQIARGKEQS